MKNPLHYQISEYDCGPTSMLNALIYLFDREQIPPDIIRSIMLYCLDCYGACGAPGKSGTSCAAMMFLSNWLNGCGTAGLLTISSRYLSGRNVRIDQQSEINDALHRGGAVVVRLFLDEWHYVLLTGEKDDRIYMFDPYYLPDLKHEGVCITSSFPFSYNRIVDSSMLNSQQLELYALGDIKTREAVIIYNTDTMLTENNTIEYFI